MDRSAEESISSSSRRSMARTAGASISRSARALSTSGTAARSKSPETGRIRTSPDASIVPIWKPVTGRGTGASVLLCETSVPLSLGEAAEDGETDQDDDDAPNGAAGERQDQPDDHDDATQADSAAPFPLRDARHPPSPPLDD